MSPEEQRIAIAEACGWVTQHDSNQWAYFRPDGRGWNGDVPDYLNDLNAMHEAEKLLDDRALWKGYINRLWDVVCPERPQLGGLDAAIGLLLVHATAAQRAEAFLKTLNLWKP